MFLETSHLGQVLSLFYKQMKRDQKPSEEGGVYASYQKPLPDERRGPGVQRAKGPSHRGPAAPLFLMFDILRVCLRLERTPLPRSLRVRVVKLGILPGRGLGLLA